MADFEIMNTPALRLAEMKNGEPTGAEYQYSSHDGYWYCYAHKSWRHRWLKQPALFSCELKRVALEKGANEEIFHRRVEEAVEEESKPKKSRKKSSKNFISRKFKF